MSMVLREREGLGPASDAAKPQRDVLFRETPAETLERWTLGAAWAVQPRRLGALPALSYLWLRDLVAPASGLPDPERTLHDSGLCGMVHDLSPATLVEAYRRGLFTFAHLGPLKWLSLPERSVLFFDELHVGNTMRRIAKKGRYRVTFDTAFEDVIKACAGRRENKWHVTWITPRIMRAYAGLYDAGHVHSFEVWNERDELVGGGYGVAIGRVFFTESQFSREPNTSKLGFALLNQHLDAWGYVLNDGKWMTPTIAPMGFRMIPRHEFLDHLESAVDLPGRTGRWQTEFNVESLAAGRPKHSAALKTVQSVQRTATVTSLRATPAIEVEIADAARLAAVEAPWTDLLDRADVPNLFMDPALLRAAAQTDSKTSYRALLAWKTVDGRKQLAGLWGFAVGRPRRSVLPFRVLVAPSCSNGYLATPVVDRAALDETLNAMLDAVAAHPQLPKIITLDMMTADDATMAALTRVLAARGTAPCEFERNFRPRLASGLDAKTYLEKALSGSSRKKLRQHRRRLAEQGKLASVCVTEPEAVRGAFDDFLQLEVAGWKGREGTALLCNAREAAFMRAAVFALAQRGRASIHALELDGKPISIQIMARSGRAAFTWKTAYDERFRDFSPGMLLLEDYTAALLADRSIAYVDSCSYDDSGYMSAWTERQTVADLWIDARRGGSVEFQMLSALQASYRGLRAAAKNTYWTIRQGRRR